MAFGHHCAQEEKEKNNNKEDMSVNYHSSL
jgi:hypothetical protein